MLQTGVINQKDMEIQNSDGQTIAGVVDIIGQEHMKPITNEEWQWCVGKELNRWTEGMKRDEYGDPVGGQRSLRNKSKESCIKYS